MAEQRRYDRALAFCQQAAALEPGLPEIYTDALTYAEQARDSAAMTWAAGQLLKNDWPLNNETLHTRAEDKLAALARVLEAARRKAEAERMQTAVERVRQRDLVVTLSYQGEAHLDLKVKEPIGTVCSGQHRQSPGGGTFLGGTLTDLAKQSYVAAQAFSGEYEITVERVWGRPLGSKATVEVVRHQGTPQESRERHTIVLDRSHTLKVALAGGRRVTVASVPLTPPGSATAETSAEEPSGNRVLNKLRALADATFDPAAGSGLTGGLAALTGRSVPDPRRPVQGLPKTTDAVLYQSRVQSNVGAGLDLAAKVVVKGEQSFMELAPNFQGLASRGGVPTVVNPLIPGSGR
jgi:hypothetical protein